MCLKNVHRIPTFQKESGISRIVKSVCKGEGLTPRNPCTRKGLYLCRRDKSGILTMSWPFCGCAGWVEHLSAGLVCWNTSACHDVFLCRGKSRNSEQAASQVIFPDENLRSNKQRGEEGSCAKPFLCVKLRFICSLKLFDHSVFVCSKRYCGYLWGQNASRSADSIAEQGAFCIPPHHFFNSEMLNACLMDFEMLCSKFAGVKQRKSWELGVLICSP